MLKVVEKADLFNGNFEDLVYPPKTLKALQAFVQVVPDR